jgi:hypothetical protein
MSETPRTWTLRAAYGFPIDHPVYKATAIRSSRMKVGERVEVIEKAPVLDLIGEIAQSGVAFKDPRLSYVEVQIDRDLWEEVQQFSEHGRLSGEAGA